MSGSTISTVTNAGFTVSSSAQNTLLITDTGVIDVAQGTVVNDTGVYISGVYGRVNASIVNLGSVLSDAFVYYNPDRYFALGVGINLAAGGTITNGSSLDKNALIAGDDDGISLNGSAQSTVMNYGTIRTAGFADPGVTSDFAGVAWSGNGTLINGSAADTTALIAGVRGDGINSPGNIDVENFGTIIGAIGVALFGHGHETVVNAGLIEGTSGVAVYMAYATSSELMVEPGAKFDGIVHANTFHTDVLALGTGAGAGVLLGVGTNFKNFGTLSFAVDGSWSVEGDVVGLTEHLTILNFGKTDKLTLEGFDAVSDTYVSDIGLELIDAAHTTIALDIVGSFSTGSFSVVGAPSDTTIELATNAPCFAAGTWILTPRGQKRVEALRVGDLVISYEGDDQPITWIGRRKIDLSRHPNPEQAEPICIAADALGDGVPCRNLLVSPDHALFFERHLIPAKALVNNVSIYQLRSASVVYYHIELAEHGVIFAENAAAESYLETGNRGAFENGGGATVLHPDFGQPLREAESCAPFTEAGPVFERVRLRLLKRCLDRPAAPLAARI